MAKDMACNSTLIQLLSVQHVCTPLVLVLSLVMPEISDANFGLHAYLKVN